ncbi:AAA family ATPase [Immundisolibacter sp.]
MSFLIFDVDRSLASIGGDKAAEDISSLPPIQITDGITQVNSIIQKLFQREEKDYSHPLISQPIKQSFFKLNDTANKFQVQGLVIDTISHLFRQDMRLLESKNKSERLEIQDWGKLERSYNLLISDLIKLPVWVIVNSHISYDKNDLGQFLFYPQLKGSTKDFIGEYFDCILYTRVKNSNNKSFYLWQTKPDTQRYAKDRLDVLEEFIPQDFGLILNRYRQKGIEYPKILVIGESGTGKSRAIRTLGDKGQYQSVDRNNGKASIKLIN